MTQQHLARVHTHTLVSIAHLHSLYCALTILFSQWAATGVDTRKKQYWVHRIVKLSTFVADID